MKQILSDLWSGEIRPYEDLGVGNREMTESARDMSKKYRELFDSLNKEQQTALEQYYECVNRYIIVNLETSFSDGFSLGVKLAAAALSE